MAEWLRRWTRNPMGSSRTGSNPVHSANFLLPFAPFIPIPHSCLLISLSIPLKSGISWVSSSLLAWQKPSSCDGRVVKALDSKSNGIFPHRFKPCSQRHIILQLINFFFMPYLPRAVSTLFKLQYSSVAGHRDKCMEKV